MARAKHSWVVFTSFLLFSSTFPTKNVSFRSPWQPLWKTVISTGKEKSLYIHTIFIGACKLKNFSNSCYFQPLFGQTNTFLFQRDYNQINKQLLRNSLSIEKKHSLHGLSCCTLPFIMSPSSSGLISGIP